ncbi:hypothetical protein [Kitasatospora sp. NPDC057936]|uniref:hypothetical protein n=1 Tax=Kitasatospora sp. NPDC057936 TaxID=3346283 RepID=UPI0036D8F824
MPNRSIGPFDFEVNRNGEEMRKTVSRISGAVIGAGVLTALAAPQALAAPASSAAVAATQLPAGADPAHWTIDRQAPAVTLPQAPARARITPTQDSPSSTTGFTEPRNISYHGQLCGTDLVDGVSGPGPMTLTLTQARSTATQWNASASINAGVLSAGIGFNVTDTVTKTETGSYTVPDGKFGNLQAYPLYDYWTFEVYDGSVGWTVGSGEVKKPVGYCYNGLTN